jgi:hypothetical protein
MANKYGEAALIAARLDVPASVTAAERWDTAVRQLYPEKPYLQKKTAPRGAFLGLCEQGLVKGIAVSGEGSRTDQNRLYAVRAVALLQAGTHRTLNALWSEVTAGGEVTHNAQMDVVLALWKNGLIVG